MQPEFSSSAIIRKNVETPELFLVNGDYIFSARTGPRTRNSLALNLHTITSTPGVLRFLSGCSYHSTTIMGEKNGY